MPPRLVQEVCARAERVKAITEQQAKSLPGYRVTEHRVSGSVSPLIAVRVLVLDQWALLNSSLTMAELEAFAREVPEHEWLFQDRVETDEWGDVPG